MLWLCTVFHADLHPREDGLSKDCRKVTNSGKCHLGISDSRFRDLLAELSLTCTGTVKGQEKSA